MNDVPTLQPPLPRPSGATLVGQAAEVQVAEPLAPPTQPEPALPPSPRPTREPREGVDCDHPSDLAAKSPAPRSETQKTRVAAAKLGNPATLPATTPRARRRQPRSLQQPPRQPRPTCPRFPSMDLEVADLLVGSPFPPDEPLRAGIREDHRLRVLPFRVLPLRVSRAEVSWLGRRSAQRSRFPRRARGRSAPEWTASCRAGFQAATPPPGPLP